EFQVIAFLEADPMFGGDGTLALRETVVNDLLYFMSRILCAFGRVDVEMEITVAHVAENEGAVIRPAGIQARLNFRDVGFHVADGHADIKTEPRAVLVELIDVVAWRPNGFPLGGGHSDDAVRREFVVNDLFEYRYEAVLIGLLVGTLRVHD